MDDSIRIVFEPLPDADLQRYLEDNVVNLSFARTGLTEWFPVGYFLRSERGEWLGGCTGHIWGGWLHIRWLWVSETLRHRGFGTGLMDAAEAYGWERGARNATLETHSYQAPDFYRARGYTVFGTLPDFPIGHSKLFMRKALTP